jgi:predicted NUDIX family NTP pyrophosphohydrolase
MKKQSAGLLMFRIRENVLQVLLAHPGGPFWKNKDAGGWSIPKGEIEEGEEPLTTAKREFAEEIGITPRDPFYPLGSVTQKSGKVVHAWAFEGDCDPAKIQCNTVEIEWPPKSGKKMTFPEIDRAAFFTIREARTKLNPAQLALLLPLQKKFPTA